MDPPANSKSENGESGTRRGVIFTAMLPDPTTCYRALRSRDRRFDGVFFVGVTSTGIYCRPVCPARLPARDRCRFFPHPSAAEAEGFRPCLRCRPERAPGRAIVDARRSLAERAAARIGAGALDRGSVEELASSLFVGPRQLRRSVKEAYGVSPVQLAQTHRLLLAKRLLTETSLPVSRIALASGFSSLRRFNALFRQRYRMSPTRFRRGGARGPEPARRREKCRPRDRAPRATPGTVGVAEASRQHGRDGTGAVPDALQLALDYRPPLAWNSLLHFLGARAIPGVEAVAATSSGAGRYLRTVALDDHVGWVSAGPAGADDPVLRVAISPSLLPVLPALLARVRHLFDLDADPLEIGDHLARDPLLAPLIRARPGLRIPGAMDGFELGWRAILGQQVSVRGARTLAGRFAGEFGKSVREVGGCEGWPPELTRLPVQAGTVADASLERIRSVGMPLARARAIQALARAILEDDLRLEPGADVEQVVARLEGLPGIGPWTARYIALRALHWPDAFPSGDLVLRRALGGHTSSRTRRRAESWRPWRGYAALHLWAGGTDPVPGPPSESSPSDPS